MPEPPTPTSVQGISIGSALASNNFFQTTNYLANLADNPKSALFMGLVVNYLANLITAQVDMFGLLWKSHYKGSLIEPLDLSFINHRSEVKQKVLTIGNEGLEESEIAYLAPIAIGQLIDLAFPVAGDSWVDEESNILYLKPSGKTIGSASSNADFARDDIKKLFLRYHLNSELVLTSSTGQPTTRSTPEADWSANKRLALPLMVGSNQLIFTGIIN